MMVDIDEKTEIEGQPFARVDWLFRYELVASQEERREMRTTFVEEFLSSGDALHTSKKAFDIHAQDFFADYLITNLRSALLMSYCKRRPNRKRRRHDQPRRHRVVASTGLVGSSPTAQFAQHGLGGLSEEHEETTAPCCQRAL